VARHTSGLRRTGLVDARRPLLTHLHARYRRHAANRVSAVISPYGEVTYYEYLANDLTQCALLGNGVGAYYEYDVGNRITSIAHRRVSDGADLGSFHYQYDHNSNRTQLRFEGDAVPPGCGVKSIVYQYSVSSMDRLETEHYLDDMGGVLYCLDYRYDLNGNRTLLTRQPAESGLRLVRAAAAETHEEWAKGTRYLDMDPWAESRTEQLYLAHTA